MKKLIILIAILLTSYSSISQTGIQDDLIKLDTIIARAVIKDLIEGDAAKAKLKIANQIILQQDKEIKLHVEINQSLEQEKLNLEIMLSEKDNIIANKDLLIDNVNESLKKQKGKTTFFKITTVIFAITTGYLLIK